ncbi:MAG: methyltransferase domain-containing protein, partial [Bacteroidales bacterium]|nr:methyltransferase domain-containing protein [Bacteroidales bacterium]
ASKSKTWDTESGSAQTAKGIATLIVKNIELTDNMEVMDFGAGTGLLAYFVAPYIQKVVAVDNSPAMLLELKNKDFPSQIEVIEKDLSVKSINRTFDGMIASMTTHHLEDTKALFTKFYTMLKNGGFIILSSLDDKLLNDFIKGYLKNDTFYKDIKVSGIEYINDDYFNGWNYLHLLTPVLLKKYVDKGSYKFVTINDNNYEEELKEKFPVIIDELLRNNYKNPRDIGILVRTNKQAKEITELLTYYQNENSERAKYKIISGDALYIENSTAVRILISAMKYINNKHDKINLTQLVLEYQKSLSASVNYNKIFLSVENEDYIKLLPEKFLNNQDLFLQKELFELSEELIVIFGLTDKSKEFAYIKTFQNVITDFTRKHYSDLSEFLERWDEKAKNTSVQISDKTDAVNVMTIHKSKGLSFDTVLMPYTNFNFDHSSYSAPILWAKIDNQPFNKFPYLPVKYSGKLAQTFFRKDYFNEMLYSYTDTINLLYVVFTRAEKELIIFSSFNIPKTKKNTSIKDTSNALYHIVNQGIDVRVGGSGEIFNFSEHYNSETRIFDYSINYNPVKKDFIKEEIKSHLIENHYPSNHWQNKLQLKLNSEDFFIESIPELEEKVNYGKLMHSIFQNIITTDDIDKAVMKQHSEGILTVKEAEEFILKIKNTVNKKTVQHWFDGTYKVINEDALLTAKGNIRIPDRVLFSETEIVVIDFKFGKHNKKYTEQIAEYKNLLKDYYGLPVKSYLYYPENNKIIEVCGTVIY